MIRYKLDSSSHLGMFYKNRVFKNFVKFRGKRLHGSHKLQIGGLLEKCLIKLNNILQNINTVFIKYQPGILCNINIPGNNQSVIIKKSIYTPAISKPKLSQLTEIKQVMPSSPIMFNYRATIKPSNFFAEIR